MASAQQRDEMADVKPRVPGEIPSATHVQVEFGGVNLSSPRQAIGDDEFLWLENAQPIGPGQLQVTNETSFFQATLTGETVVYSMTANISGTDYIFAFCASGNAYQVKATTPFTQTKITPTPIFTSSVQATQWKNLGILIIDPTAGYFDWNVTAANHLSAISNAVNALTVTPGTGGYAISAPAITFSGGGATMQATATTDLQAVSVAINAGGTGYIAGDILTITGGAVGSTGAKAQFKVTTIGAGGAVTAATVFTSGDYSVGPDPAVPSATTGGSGTGCTITPAWGVGPVTLTSPGSGYVSPPTVTLSSVSGGAAITAGISASFAGTCIATFAGRAWIGNGRTVAFTDVNTYNSFGGAGGSFVITDSTLHQTITQIYTANNFLYIAGDASFDVLGDVLVSSGSTTFTRTNITASIGTNLPNTLFAYYRSILFANTAGMFSLAGATPQKISAKLDRLMPAIDFTQPMSACQVTVNNILSAAFLFTYTDSAQFANVAPGVARTLLAIYFNNKWWFADPRVAFAFIVSVPLSGKSVLFGWSNSAGSSTLNQVFAVNPGTHPVRIRTKLWSGGNPIASKETLRVGVGLYYNGLVGPTASTAWTVDNELGQSSTFATDATIASSSANPSSYAFLPFTATLPGKSGSQVAGKYLGLSLATNCQQITFSIFAVEYRNTRLW